MRSLTLSSVVSNESVLYPFLALIHVPNAGIANKRELVKNRKLRG